MAGLPYYTKLDLRALMEEMISTCVNDPCLDTHLIKPFAKKKGISLAEACAHIIRGKGFVVVEHDPRRPFFEGLKVAAEKTVCRTGIRPRAQVRNAITYAEAAARLGTNHNGVKGLVQASFISVEEDAGNNERICEQSLKCFEDRYVKAAAYASILDCPPTYALKQLRAEGVLGTSTRKQSWIFEGTCRGRKEACRDHDRNVEIRFVFLPRHVTFPLPPPGGGRLGPRSDFWGLDPVVGNWAKSAVLAYSNPEKLAS